MPLRLPSNTFSHWVLPLVLALVCTGTLLPATAKADDFATTFRGLGGYALLRQGDLQGAGEFFRSAYRRDAHDPLILQGLGEVALLERDATTLAECRTALEAQQALRSLDWLTTREAHLKGHFADALVGYASFIGDPGWSTVAIDGILSIHLELGDLPFRAVLSGLAQEHPEAVAAINLLNGSWATASYDDHVAASPWQAEAYVAANDLPTVEQAIRDFWSTRQDTAASSLLNALASRNPRDARVQSLLKEQLLVRSNHIPVPPAKRKLPAGSLASAWSGESGWDLAGLMPQDLPLSGPLAEYWNQIDAVLAVSEGYYINLVNEFTNLKADLQTNVDTRNAAGLMENLARFNTLVEGAITMSQREIQATGALPVPVGFETFAAKLREFQDLRTAAFVDLRTLVQTQNTAYADAATAKANQMEGMVDGIVDEFLKAYQNAPAEWKTPPAEAEAAEGEVGLVDGEQKQMSDGERLYGPGWDFEIPKDGSLTPIDEGDPID